MRELAETADDSDVTRERTGTREGREDISSVSHNRAHGVAASETTRGRWEKESERNRKYNVHLFLAARKITLTTNQRF